jgi:hypothetical protein
MAGEGIRPRAAFSIPQRAARRRFPRALATGASAGRRRGRGRSGRGCATRGPVQAELGAGIGASGRRRVRTWRAWSRPVRPASGAEQEGGPAEVPDAGRSKRGARAGAAGPDVAPGGNGRPAPGPRAPAACPAPAATPDASPTAGSSGMRWSPSGGLWASIVLWSATWAVWALVPIAADEGLVLRWLRAAAEHPARTALAGGLLALAWPRAHRAPASGVAPQAAGEARSYRRGKELG